MSNIDIIYEHITDLYTQSIPKRIGSYVITHTYNNINVERYVGSTTNLYNRLNTHLSNKNIIYIDMYVTDNLELALSLEKILMELIKPATNIRVTSLSDEDKEIMNNLLNNAKLKDYISSNEIKIGYRYLKYVNGINNGIINPNKRYKCNIPDKVYDLIIRKQSELFKIEGNKRTVSEIAEKSLMKGLDLI